MISFIPTEDLIALLRRFVETDAPGAGGRIGRPAWTAYTDDGAYCVYCGTEASPYEVDVDWPHEADCVVAEARKLLGPTS